MPNVQDLTDDMLLRKLERTVRTISDDELLRRIGSSRVQLAADKAQREVAEDIPSTELLPGVSGLAGLAADTARDPRNLVRIGSVAQDVSENLQRAGQFVGETAGVLGPQDRARMDRELAVDDAGSRQLEEVDPTRTAIARGATEAAMFAAIPGGVTGGLLRRAGTGALAGGTTAALATGEDQDPLTNFAVGALFGSVAPLVMSGASKALNKMFNKDIQVFTQEGRFTEDAIALLKGGDDKVFQQLNRQSAIELRKAGVLTADQARDFNLFRGMNMTPTRAQLTQTADDFQFQQEAAKRSGPIRSALDEQDVQLNREVDALIESAGGRATDEVGASVVAFDAAITRIKTADQAINAAYRVAREAAPTQKVVRPTRFALALGVNRAADTATNGLVSAMIGAAKRFGVLDDGLKVQGRISVESAEGLRKEINALIGENKFARTRIGRELKDALDKDVMAAVGDDVFAPARSAKARLERSLEADRRTGRAADRETLLQKVTREKVDEEKLVDLIVKKTTRAEDVEALRSFYLSGSADEVAAGKEAMAEIGSAMIRRAYMKALSQKTELGVRMFNGPAFKRNLDAIGSRKLAAFLDADILSAVGVLTRIGEIRVPVAFTGIGKGPSAQAIREIVNDSKTMRFLGIMQKVFSRKQQQFINPARQTEQGIRAGQRLQPRAGSVGAVTTEAHQPDLGTADRF